MVINLANNLVGAFSPVICSQPYGHFSMSNKLAKITGLKLLIKNCDLLHHNLQLMVLKQSPVDKLWRFKAIILEGQQDSSGWFHPLYAVPA